MEENFYELNDETLEIIQKVYGELYFAFDPSIKYIGNSKLKTAIVVKKTNPIVEHMTGFQIIVEVNEDIVDALGEDPFSILIYQELGRIEMSLDTGKIKINKLKLQTSVSTVKRYGVDLVAEANEAVIQYVEQQKDIEETE